jgi:S-methylmethionine-dependent homocysteine/selenocysteine methylase
MADDVLIIDGATGTELGRRGVDISLPLWSARALMEAPEMLAAVHRDYLDAGAGAVTTNTFRTHRRTLAKAGLGHRAAELTRRAVEIAAAARDERNPRALVLGSVAPLEDCYQPELAPGPAACLTEHDEMIGNLLEAGVDLLLIETMNNMIETSAAIDAARDRAPDRWIVSFCARSKGPPGVMLSGELISSMADQLRDAFAVGVNCVAAPAIEAHVVLLRRTFPDTRIIAYGNIGSADESGNWITTDAASPAQYAACARRWIDAGASIVGGCCGTTPETIRALARMVMSRTGASTR